MSQSAAVLFTNEAFYVAFQTRDADAMDAVWSNRNTVTCIHPGWNAITGREAVMESWQAILGNPKAPRIRCLDPQAHVLGEVAYVVCYEALESGILIATNVFIREDGVWKMVHHQAGASQPPPTHGDTEPQRLQ